MPCHSGAKVMLCALRGHNSGEKIPLLMVDESGDEDMDDDNIGSLWPRAYSKACTDDKGVQRKIPYRKLCSICKLIFSGAAFFTSGGV